MSSQTEYKNIGRKHFTLSTSLSSPPDSMQPSNIIILLLQPSNTTRTTVVFAVTQCQATSARFNHRKIQSALAMIEKICKSATTFICVQKQRWHDRVGAVRSNQHYTGTSEYAMLVACSCDDLSIVESVGKHAHVRSLPSCSVLHGGLLWA